MPNTYDAGDLIRLRATFAASGGGFVDPASVYMQVKAPGGAVTTYGYPSVQIKRTATGGYYLDVLASQVGPWQWRVAGGPSTGLSAAEGVFQVVSNFIL